MPTSLPLSPFFLVPLACDRSSRTGEWSIAVRVQLPCGHRTGWRPGLPGWTTQPIVVPDMSSSSPQKNGGLFRAIEHPCSSDVRMNRLHSSMSRCQGCAASLGHGDPRDVSPDGVSAVTGRLEMKMRAWPCSMTAATQAMKGLRRHGSPFTWSKHDRSSWEDLLH